MERAPLAGFLELANSLTAWMASVVTGPETAGVPAIGAPGYGPQPRESTAGTPASAQRDALAATRGTAAVPETAGETVRPDLAPAPTLAAPDGAGSETGQAAAEFEARTGRPGVTEPEVGTERPGAAETETGSGPPTTAAEVRSRTAAVVAGWPHPNGPRADRADATIRSAGRRMTGRNLARAAELAAAPSRVVGAVPAHRPVPRPDPGPIPAQTEAVRKLFGRVLDPAALPPVTRSPRGTLPDVTREVLTAPEIRAITLGDQGIVELVTGTDRASLHERERLQEIRASLGARTATAPPVTLDLPLLPALEPPMAAPIVDEPVPKVALPPAQRALLAGVVSELRTDPAGQARQVLGLVRQQDATYPGGALDRAFKPPFEAGLVPAVQAAMTGEVDTLATALALTPEELTAAMTDRRAEVRRMGEAATATADNGLTGARTVVAAGSARVSTTVRATAWAATQAVAADRVVARKTGRIQARVEAALAQLREPVAVELARLDEQLRHRERAIADAVRVQISAIRVAQAADEIALTPADERYAGARQWADAAIDALTDVKTGSRVRLVEAAETQTKAFKSDLESAATTALAALREWGAAHVRATDTWWTELDTRLQSWAGDAGARAELWATREGHTTRLALTQDLETLQHLSALQSAGRQQETAAYLAGLDGEARTFVHALAGSSKLGAADLAGAMAASVRHRVGARYLADWSAALDRAVLALPDTEENFQALVSLLGIVQPTWKPVDKAGAIHASVKRWRGFDEEKIFEALADLTPLAAKVLEWQYVRTSEGQTLMDALHGHGHAGHLSEDELKTAEQLLSGDRVEGAIGAIHSAISGPGAEMDAVNRIMRGLSPQERLTVVAGYQDRYDDNLEADLNSQWSVSRSEVSETMLISRSDLEGAEAVALQRSVRTVYAGGGEGTPPERVATIDRDAAATVYARIRRDVEAEGERHGWLSAQIEAEIAHRGRRLGARFDKEAAGEWWAEQRRPGTSPTQAAFALAGPAGKELLEGLAANDRVRIDVARVRLEDEGVYAEDAALDQIFREQATRSLTEVQRDYGSFLSARTDRDLDSEEPFPTDEARADRRMELQREQDKRLEAMADERTTARMETLDAAYAKRSGRSLEQMVGANMSEASKQEGLARVAAKGVLTPYQKLRFSIEGVGTDLPMLRSTLATMSKTEIDQADTDWRAGHDGESLLDAIHGDTSGRDEGDLVDQVLYGAPRTTAELVGAARRKFDRDRAGETFVGHGLTATEIEYAGREVEHMEKAYERMRLFGQSRADQERAGREFALSLDRVNTAIELQRQALDSVTDALATITGLVVGVLLIPFTGGASLVAVAAASAAATAATMLVKTVVKGSAYGLGEAGADLALGLVDIAVSVLTAGLGHALLGRVAGAAAGRVSAAERTAIARVLSSFGIAGRTAARAETAGTGLLVRRMGSIGVLKGLDQSKFVALQRIARTGAWLTEQVAQAVPNSLAGALMDESVYRQPGGARALFDNTLTGAVHSIAVAGAMHLTTTGVHALREAFRAAPPPGARPITGDILGHAGTPRERLAEFHEWRRSNPDGSLHDFTAERTARQIERMRVAGAEHDQVRRARAELLAGLPSAERGQYANLPIRPVDAAEFARLGGGERGGAHLLVEGGQAVVLVRAGAAPGAVGALLPAVREKVFPHFFGMTVEAALPRHLRDTPIRIDRGLPAGEIQVRAIPRTGRIVGVEVVLGPHVNPIDVALHAGEITRIRRWTGLIGDARTALARQGERFGFDSVSPRERSRFEAAGELRKLVPILEERIRRTLRATDPVARADLEREVVGLVAQHDRARRILSGELIAEPRGYVAQEGVPTLRKQIAGVKRSGAERGRLVHAEEKNLEKLRAALGEYYQPVPPEQFAAAQARLFDQFRGEPLGDYHERLTGLGGEVLEHAVAHRNDLLWDAYQVLLTQVGEHVKVVQSLRDELVALERTYRRNNRELAENLRTIATSPEEHRELLKRWETLDGEIRHKPLEEGRLRRKLRGLEERASLRFGDRPWLLLPLVDPHGHAIDAHISIFGEVNLSARLQAAGFEPLGYTVDRNAVRSPDGLKAALAAASGRQGIDGVYRRVRRNPTVIEYLIVESKATATRNPPEPTSRGKLATLVGGDIQLSPTWVEAGLVRAGLHPRDLHNIRNGLAALGAEIQVGHPGTSTETETVIVRKIYAQTFPTGTGEARTRMYTVQDKKGPTIGGEYDP